MAFGFCFRIPHVQFIALLQGPSLHDSLGNSYTPLLRLITKVMASRTFPFNIVVGHTDDGKGNLFSPPGRF